VTSESCVAAASLPPSRPAVRRRRAGRTASVSDVDQLGVLSRGPRPAARQDLHPTSGAPDRVDQLAEVVDAPVGPRGVDATVGERSDAHATRAPRTHEKAVPWVVPLDHPSSICFVWRRPSPELRPHLLLIIASGLQVLRSMCEVPAPPRVRPQPTARAGGIPGTTTALLVLLAPPRCCSRPSRRYRREVAGRSPYRDGSPKLDTWSLIGSSRRVSRPLLGAFRPRADHALQRRCFHLPRRGVGPQKRDSVPTPTRADHAEAARRES